MQQQQSLFLGILALIVIVGGGVFYYITQMNTDGEPRNVGEVTVLTGLELASRSMEFMKSTQNEDGSFELRYRCSEGMCVSESEDEEPHSGQATMSFYNYYKQTGDESYKELADKGVAYMLNLCEEGDLDACEWNFFSFGPYYKDTGDAKYLNAMKKAGEEVFLKDDLDLLEQITNVRGAKLEALYNFTQDERYKNLLISLAEQALTEDGKLLIRGPQMFTTEAGRPVYAREPLTVWNLYLPAYRVSKEEKFLEAAIEFAQNSDIDRNVFYYRGEVYHFGLIQYVESLMMLTELDPSNASEYRDKAQRVVALQVARQYDSPEFPKYDAGNNFVTGEPYKQTNINGWYLNLIMRFFPLAPFPLGFTEDPTEGFDE